MNSTSINNWKFVFLIFAIIEIGVGIIIHLLSAADIVSIHGQGVVIQEPAMFYVKSFGNTVVALGFISLLAYFSSSTNVKQVCAIAFALFNYLASLTCICSEAQLEMYIIGGYGHLLFAILFTYMAYQK